MTALVNFLLYLLIFLVFFQDFIGILLFNFGLSFDYVKLFLSLKDILLFFIIFFNFINHAVSNKKIKINLTLLYFLIYVTFVIGYFLFIENRGKNINDLRSLIFPFYAYIAGYTSIWMKENKTLNWLGKLALVSASVSLLFYFLGPSFFVKIKTLAYTQEGRGFYGMVYKGLPSTFFSHFGGIDIFRLAGPILNPLGTSVLFIFALSIIYYNDYFKNVYLKWALITFLILSIFLTFSRGPIIGFLLGFVFVDRFVRKYKRKSSFYVYFLFVTIILVFFGHFSNMAEDTLSISDSSSRGHFLALLRSWDYVTANWLGAGIGSVGKWVRTDFGAAGENSLAMIIGQIGIFAFLFLMLTYINIFRKIIGHINSGFNRGLVLFFITILFDSFFSSVLLSATPLILFWFFVGYSENRMIPKRTYPDEVVSVKSQT